MITFKQHLAEIISIKSKPKDQKAIQFADSLYRKYPSNPMDNREFVMSFGSGEDQKIFIVDMSKPDMGPPGTAYISFVRSSHHKSGVGSEGMKMLQKLAKAEGLGLALSVWDKGTVSKSKLTRWYRELGFVTKGGQMVWRP